ARAAPGSGGPMKRSVEHDHHDRAGGRHPHEAPPDHAARAAAEGHDDQAEPAGHAAHAAHADHAGHSPEAFRGRFWVSLLLTLPVLYLSEQLQAWFGYRARSEERRVGKPGRAGRAPRHGQPNIATGQARSW